MDWSSTCLKNLLLDAKSGIWGSPPDESRTAFPVLRSTNIRAGKLVIDNLAYRTVSRSAIERYALERGDILVTTSSGSPRLVGKNAIIGDLPGNSDKYLFSNFTLRLRPAVSRVFPKYLYHYLNSPPARLELERIQSTTSGLRNLNTKLYLAQNVPLPPISEQRRIVEILDQTDRLRQLHAEVTAKIDRVLPALFIKMFGDPVSNPNKWPSDTLAHLSTLGPQYGANARSLPLSGNQPRYVRITDIEEGGHLRSGNAVSIDIDNWDRYKLQKGDLLFARSGATVGKAYVHRSEDRPSVFAGYLIRFRLDTTRLHPNVAFAFTQTKAYRRWVERKQRKAAQPNINGNEYASLLLPVPDRALQDQFTQTYSGVETACHRLRRSSQKLERLYSVLVNRAFSGALSASWRKIHETEILREMEQQRRLLAQTAVAH